MRMMSLDSFLSRVDLLERFLATLASVTTIRPCTLEPDEEQGASIGKALVPVTRGG